MVTSKEIRAAINALNESYLTSGEIASTTHVRKRTVYRIMKNFKETGSTKVQDYPIGFNLVLLYGVLGQ